MKWFRHGVLNTAEHGMTRIADALVSLLLLWFFTPEVFGSLILAQATVAPFLLLFIAPETVLYREFSDWMKRGPAYMGGCLKAFRIFGRVKLIAAVLLSFAIASYTQYKLDMMALLWAFTLTLAPQMSGGDREFLRLDLKMKELNFLTLYQKATMLGGTLWVAVAYPGRIDVLAIAAMISAVSTAWISQAQVTHALKIRPERMRLTVRSQRDAEDIEENPPPMFDVIARSLKDFSFWSHLSGVVTNWVQTLDVFLMGVFGLPARTVGLYAASLKIAGFALALPTALSNLFSIWISRLDKSVGVRSKVVQYSLLLMAITAVESVVLYFVSPYLFEFLSRGRWFDEEVASMTQFLGWFLMGNTLFAGGMIVGAAIMLRGNVKRLLFTVTLPWWVFALVIYGYAAKTSVLSVAQANVAVGLASLMLVFGRFLFSREIKPGS